MSGEQGRKVTHQGTKTGTEARGTKMDGHNVTATCVEEDITARKSASTHVNIVTLEAPTDPQSVEEEEEKTGTTTRRKDSGSQEARTNHHTKEYLTDKELLENH